jgi:hypothetical protein
MSEAGRLRKRRPDTPAVYYVFGDGMRCGNEGRAVAAMHTLLAEPDGAWLAWRQVFLSAATSGVFLFGQNTPGALLDLYDKYWHATGITNGPVLCGMDPTAVETAHGVGRGAGAHLLAAAVYVARLSKSVLVDQATPFTLAHMNPAIHEEDAVRCIPQQDAFLRTVLSGASGYLSGAVAQAAVCVAHGAPQACVQACVGGTLEGEVTALMAALRLLWWRRAGVAWAALEWVCRTDVRYTCYDGPLQALRRMALLTETRPTPAFDKTRVFLVAAVMMLTRVAPAKTQRHVVDAAPAADVRPMTAAEALVFMQQRADARRFDGRLWIMTRSQRYGPRGRGDEMPTADQTEYYDNAAAAVPKGPGTTKALAAERDLDAGLQDAGLLGAHAGLLRTLASTRRVPKRARLFDDAPLNHSSPRELAPSWFPREFWLMPMELPWTPLFPPADAAEVLVRVIQEDYLHCTQTQNGRIGRLAPSMLATKCSLVLKGPVDRALLARLAGRAVVEEVLAARSLPPFCAFDSGGQAYLLLHTAAADSGAAPPRPHEPARDAPHMFACDASFVITQMLVCYLIDRPDMAVASLRVSEPPVRVNLADDGRPSDADAAALRGWIESKGMRAVLTGGMVPWRTALASADGREAAVRATLDKLPAGATDRGALDACLAAATARLDALVAARPHDAVDQLARFFGITRPPPLHSGSREH